MRRPPTTTRLVTAEQMADLDRAAIQGRGIPALRLMERAGKEAAHAIAEWWKSSGLSRRPKAAGPVERGKRPPVALPGLGAASAGPVLILCGRGNNGGDGLEAARQLKAAGFVVRALVASDEESLSVDSQASYEACVKGRVPVTLLPDPRAWGPGSEAADAMERAAFLVDALLGTGSKGRPRGAVAAAIELAMASGKPIASIDLPSGVDGSTGHVESPAIRADFTVTLALAKVGLALEPGREHAGAVEVVDIGIPPDLVEATQPSVLVAGAAWARSLLPHRPADAHKGSVGRVLVVGGSAGMIGAVALASESALRVGAGYTVAAVPRSCVDPLESRISEVVKRGCAETDGRSLARAALDAILVEAMRSDVVAIGPGLSRHPDTEDLARDLLERVEAPIVLDADGLNAFEGKSLRRTHGPLIVTPHYGEAARLVGRPIGEVARDPAGWARAFAEASGAIVCLKSVPMVTAAKGEPVILNSTGNPGMATAGAGDVLTGTIAGLLAQGMDPVEAAAVGCLVHGLAGDIAARRLGRRGMIAGDIRDALPAALVALESGALDES
ncbi:MAG: NAD(P)H-hydrate dehydratase [Candidatus Eisenbacteria bacterium]|uniref:Bifunctional NAD(P)H-hydrate repair enzyme n=1 Tax=Eiseniibacteriota bacterium TaxID=2212470 RepID=A0A538THM5_UNCEI|nr:MAG: NAD(P)H-hydrate dehydratase [Candidatus Eisenbacteria bacterium]